MNFSLKYYIPYGKENFGGAGAEPPRKFFEIYKNFTYAKKKNKGPGEGNLILATWVSLIYELSPIDHISELSSTTFHTQSIHFGWYSNFFREVPSILKKVVTKLKNARSCILTFENFINFEIRKETQGDTITMFVFFKN